MDIRELRYFTQVARSGSFVRAASVLNVTQSAISRQLQKLEAEPILLEMRGWPPISITTDKLGSYSEAIRRLQRDGRLSRDVMHRTSKYLSNIIEADHG